MRSLVILSLIAAIVICNSYTTREYDSISMSKSKFGAIEMIHESEDLMYKQIHMPEGNILSNIDLQMDHMKDLEAKLDDRRNLRSQFPTCDVSHPEDNGYFYLFPMYIGDLHEETQMIDYKGTCFESLKFEIEFVPSKENYESVRIHLDASGAKSMFCKDYFFIGTTNLYHVDFAFMGKKHVFEFANLNADDKVEIEKEGVKLFHFCDGIVDELSYTFQTIKLFLGGQGHNPDIPIIGGKIPAYQENANIEWISNN